MAEQQKDFFISYNGKDKDWAEWIAWQLEEKGYSVVIQAWDFRPGGNFVQKMQEATAQSDRTLAVLSPNYLSAQFTQPEWTAAFVQDPTGEKGILLPVRVVECDPQGLLPAIIYIDLVGLEETAAREKLLSGIQQGRAKPSVPPGFPPGRGHVERQPPRFPNPLSPVSPNLRSLQSDSANFMKSIVMEKPERLTEPNFGKVKIDLCQRLGLDWQSLADYFEIPTPDRTRFDKGWEPQRLWEWLDARGKLGELAAGLRYIGRDDLASLLPKELPNRPR